MVGVWCDKVGVGTLVVGVWCDKVGVGTLVAGVWCDKGFWDVSGRSLV